MIDTHIHMVPEVDDGAKDMDVAIKMLHMALDEGVREMILTPHFNRSIYNNQNVEKQYNLIKDYIVNEKIDFKVHLGNEIYLSEENIESIKTGEAHTMGNSRYLLLELPRYHYYPFHEDMMQDLQKSGYKILLAHVERYQIFIKKPDKLIKLIEKGIYTQMTSRYIMDNKTRRKALKMIGSGLIHIVASDGHGVENRPPVMKFAFDIVSKAFGIGCANILFIDNPGLMTDDCELVIPVIKKAKKFGFINQLIK